MKTKHVCLRDQSVAKKLITYQGDFVFIHELKVYPCMSPCNIDIKLIGQNTKIPQLRNKIEFGNISSGVPDLKF